MTPPRRVRTKAVNVVCGMAVEGDRRPEGWQLVPCAGCGCDLWLSPAGKDVLLRHDGAVTVCVADDVASSAFTPGEVEIREVPGGNEIAGTRKMTAAVDFVRRRVEEARKMRRRG